MRNIYLPELIEINIKNYSLYPQGLDFRYDFVNGINLVIGGNGMGKTTFVNIIRFAIIGPYRQQFSFTRTYKDKKIEKRRLNRIDYFRNRMDMRVDVLGRPVVILKFKLNGVLFCITRSLDDMSIQKCVVDDVALKGDFVTQDHFEQLPIEEKKNSLPWMYEKEVERLSNLTFDDLIFFVNEVLYFGEDHKTILWGENQEPDVQNELFNKYFNDRELDAQRQEAERQSKYYDSLSRHRSEDIRAITKVLERINPKSSTPEQSIDVLKNLMEVCAEIEQIDKRLGVINKEQSAQFIAINTLRHDKNDEVIRTSDLDKHKSRLESLINANKWERVNPRYALYLRNVQMNHVCPMCNQSAEDLYQQVQDAPSRCFVCGKEIKRDNIGDIGDQYDAIVLERKKIYQHIDQLDKDIYEREMILQRLDEEFHQLEVRKRDLQQRRRELEYVNTTTKNNGDIAAINAEIASLQKQKEEYMYKSQQFRIMADEISGRISETIIQNTKYFSDLFAGYAELFLGVKCALTYAKNEHGERRFYPIIDGQVRWNEEELSESQRFFVDHSFRMSILTFFYTTPTFYVVETPDSSLDLSYEHNAALVFRHFLRNPNSLIITSNLNNSSFVQNLVVGNSDVCVSMVGLLDIAKQSAIQDASSQMKQIYSELKTKIGKI